MLPPSILRSSFFLLFLIGIQSCTSENTSTNPDLADGWVADNKIVKQDGIYRFSFPTEGFVYENKDKFIQELKDAMEKNKEILEIEEYTHPMKVYFVSSRQEMELNTGMAASGIAIAWMNEIHLAAYTEDESDSTDAVTKPPIQHELMHLMASTVWGYPNMNLTWINEGLATYAANVCSGFTVEEIYRFMLEEGHLYEPSAFDNNFYEMSEMVGYHQSAYLVQCLIQDYGIDGFRDFWQADHFQFEDVFGITFEQFVENVNMRVMERVPEKPDINWDVFVEGCVG